MDYFLEEVLAQTGPEIIGTLLRSSVLDQLSVPVVSAVAAIPVSAAARFLEYLERNNLFVLSLEGRDGWFRLHPLLLDTLRQRLQTVEASEAIAVFHRRAADWFNARGMSNRPSSIPSPPATPTGRAKRPKPDCCPPSAAKTCSRWKPG
jgi:ATP/maltotriose-dependent transcriptional regulator MalT